jgi:hypothetical protein
MSIQFRSRIKSVIDYSKVLNGIGVCCDKDGNKTLKAFYDCFNDGGNYFPGTVPDLISCPPADTEKGCCCACSFVDDLDNLSYPWNFNTNSPVGNQYYDSGVVCNVTRCECERLKGKFTPSTEQSITLDATNIDRYCYKDAPEFGLGYIIDARYPRSCCHVEPDPNTGWPTQIVCENICLNSECAALGSATYPAVYDNKSTCNVHLYQENSINMGLNQCDSPLRLSQMVNKNKTYQNIEFGSCYELTKNTNNSLEYTCELKPKILCDGYWTAKEDSLHPYCDDRYTPNSPVKVGNAYDVQKLTSTQFESLKLEIGQQFQGGKYIGVYTPGSPVNSVGSELYGNLNFGNASKFIPDQLGTGGNHKKWAIIVDETLYQIPFIDNESDEDYDTSLWDGYYNTYGNLTTFNGINTKLMNSIKYKNRNGFIDYYLPSLYELFFYWNYTINNSVQPKLTKYLTSSLFSTKYINEKTSTTKINSKGFVYGGIISDYIYDSYKTILIEKTKQANAMFFRKIVIEN